MRIQSTFTKCLSGLVAFMMMVVTVQTSASTIFWASEFNDQLFDSHGSALNETFSFELGTFDLSDPSFTAPTLGNISQWSAHWKVFDRAYDPDANGWNAPDQFFVGTVEHNALGGSDSPDANPADVFAQGDVAYLWVYNTKDILSTSEWALLMDANSVGNLANQWIFPDPLDPPGTSYTWQLSDADTAIVGGVNDVQGPGEYSLNPGTFSLQTAVVPEPGSALLLLAASGLWLAGRRKK